MTANCPICRNADVRCRRTDKHIADNAFMVCRACGHGFCAKPAFTDAGTAQTEYNQKAFFGATEADPIPKWFEGSEQIDEVAAAWHLANFLRHRRGDHFLDIGCGLGAFLNYVQHNSSLVCHGNDISAKACKIVSQRLRIATYPGPFDRALFKGQTFDMIFLSHVIEHIPDPHSFVRDIAAIAAPGAVIGVVCPNDASITAATKRSFFYRFTKLHEYGHLHWPMHLGGFTPKSLNLVFSSAGFDTLHLSTWSKAQRLYGEPLKRCEWLAYPMYIMERIFKRGNLIVGYFQWNSTSPIT